MSQLPTMDQLLWVGTVNRLQQRLVVMKDTRWMEVKFYTVDQTDSGVKTNQLVKVGRSIWHLEHNMLVVTWNNHQDKIDSLQGNTQFCVCLTRSKKIHFLCSNRYYFPSFVTVPEVFPIKCLSKISFKWLVNCYRAWRSSLLFFTHYFLSAIYFGTIR